MFSITQQIKKIAAVFLILIILPLANPNLFVPKAEAFFGGMVVIDPAAIAAISAAGTAQTTATVTGWLQEAWRFISDKVLKVLLAALKKRLLDEITRETVEWVQGGGTPLFLQKPGRVFSQAADEAAGEVIQQVGGGQLCAGIPFNVNFYLAQPDTTKKQTSCTLTQVVGNLEAFKRDFKTGGWLGYTDLLKPQNNQYGLEILTQQALEQSIAQKQQESVLKQNINLGFNSDACVTWTLYDKKTNQPVKGAVPVSAIKTATGDYTNPKTPPPAPDSNSSYKCTQVKTTTPGRTIAEGLNKSLGSNIDFIVNSDDLTNVLAAVLDAAFNRLVKEGVNGVKSGLASLSESGDGEGVPPSTVGTEYNNYNRQNQDAINSQIAVIVAPLNSAERALNEASSTLTSAAGLLPSLFNTAKALSQCVALVGSSADIGWASSTMMFATSTYPAQITKQRGDITGEKTRITTIRNGLASGSLPTESQKDAITAAAAAASDISNAATTLSNDIQSSSNEAQSRLNACISANGGQRYP